MAFLHCHNCGWSQDDFWSRDITSYHPFRDDIVAHLRLSLFQDKVYFDRQIWSGMPPTVANLLATASVTDIGLHFDFGAGNTLDIVGIFNANLLADDILFL